VPAHRHPGLAPLAAALVATLAAACADRAPTGVRDPAAVGGPARIVNGSYDAANAWPAVGALLYDFDRNGRYDADDQLCTGTLVSPTVVVTAAHCVEFLPPGAALRVSFASDLNGRPATIAATGFAYDPRYGTSQMAQLHDIAVVLVPASATRGITPMRLPTAGLLDQLRAAGVLTTQALLFNVGYGVSAARTGRPGFGYDGRRNVSRSPFSALTPTWLKLNMNNAATNEGGDCYGDSGGPKILDRAGYRDIVLATVTTGDANCRATTWDWRTDTPEARAFLAAYVTLP
jgi:hypothetical protein